MPVQNKALSLSLALAGAAWLISLPALAGDYAGKGAAMEKLRHWSIQQMDKDGDGKISQEEFLAAGKKHFERIDKNGDGKISQKEFLAAGKKHFERIDKNGDGYVTEEEIQAAAQAWLKKHMTDAQKEAMDEM